MGRDIGWGGMWDGMRDFDGNINILGVLLFSFKKKGGRWEFWYSFQTER